jgi:hypothetical protein
VKNCLTILVSFNLPFSFVPIQMLNDQALICLIHFYKRFTQSALTRSVFELGISYLHQNWSTGSHKASEAIRFCPRTPGVPCAHVLHFWPFWPNTANFDSIHFFIYFKLYTILPRTRWHCPFLVTIHSFCCADLFPSRRFSLNPLAQPKLVCFFSKCQNVKHTKIYGVCRFGSEGNFDTLAQLSPSLFFSSFLLTNIKNVKMLKISKCKKI